MTDPRERRLSALRTSLEAAELDAMLITSLPNIRYLSGFSGSSALLLVSANQSLLITDFRYAVQAKEEAGTAAMVEIEQVSLWSRLWSALPSSGAATVGFESGNLSHADFQRFADNGQRWRWRAMAGIVEALRERKDEQEVADITHAVRIAEMALQHTVERIKEGMTELEICGILEGELRAMGSENHPFETIVATGGRAALPHARCSSRSVGRGEFVLIDFGAVHRGYCSDVTRTFSLGRATEEMKEIHAVVREANAEASAVVRAGLRGRDADAVARGYIDRRGWGEAFGHSLGHGIGLEVHEAPRLSKASDALLPVGAVVTIEPGIYRPGWGGVRIEDDVFLSESGPRLLTTFTRELLEIG